MYYILQIAADQTNKLLRKIELKITLTASIVIAAEVRKMTRLSRTRNTIIVHLDVALDVTKRKSHSILSAPHAKTSVTTGI